MPRTVKTAPNRVESLFHEARKRSPAERDAYLDGACGDDDRLRARVEALLASDQDSSTSSDRFGTWADTCSSCSC